MSVEFGHGQSINLMPRIPTLHRLAWKYPLAEAIGWSGPAPKVRNSFARSKAPATELRALASPP
jgi:hypothetical protein